MNKKVKIELKQLQDNLFAVVWISNSGLILFKGNEKECKEYALRVYGYRL